MRHYLSSFFEQEIVCPEYPCPLVKEYKMVRDEPEFHEKDASYKELCRQIDKCDKRIEYKGMKYCKVNSEWG